MTRKGCHPSEETRRKLSESIKALGMVGDKHPMFGKRHPEGTKQKISLALKGKKPSEETKRKWSESRRGERNPMYGKTHTPEVRAKLAEAQRMRRGWHHTEETKWKISQSKTGVKRPQFGDEWRRLLSESGKGRVISEEHRRRLSESFTEERKQGQAESMRGHNNPPH